MSRARLGYDFVAVPRRRHPGWVGLKNSYGQFLFSPLFEIAEGAPIPFHGSDWRVWLCRVWCLVGKARSPVCKALDELAERGVIAIGEGWISVLYRPEDEHKEGARKPKSSSRKEQLGSDKEQLSPNSGRHFDSSVENHSTLKIQTDRQNRQTEESERAGARTHARDFRKPLPDPPPNLEPREQPLGEWIAAEHAKRFIARTGASPGGANRYQVARDIARWVEGNSEAYRLGNRPLATKLLDGLFVSERASSKRWPLSWILQDPTEFCGTPKAVEAPAAKPALASPTHREWVPPDYEQQVREANERSLREQELWFEQHPELRAAHEESERKLREELEAEKAARKVVRIEEAKPPVRGYRPKTPEELEARRQFLQEQARQLMAANTAK